MTSRLSNISKWRARQRDGVCCPIVIGMMMIQVGHVCELVRYPVKSMAGSVTESAYLGWHGLDGDRRFAFRRLGDPSGFPWLSASRLPELLLYHPFGLDDRTGEPLP